MSVKQLKICLASQQEVQHMLGFSLEGEHCFDKSSAPSYIMAIVDNCFISTRHLGGACHRALYVLAKLSNPKWA